MRAPIGAIRFHILVDDRLHQLRRLATRGKPKLDPNVRARVPSIER